MNHSASSSDLSRNPAQVFRAADDGPVTITPRDGEPLILLRTSLVQREEFAREIVQTSRACASIANHDQLVIVLAERKSTAEALASGYGPGEELCLAGHHGNRPGTPGHRVTPKGEAVPRPLRKDEYRIVSMGPPTLPKPGGPPGRPAQRRDRGPGAVDTSTLADGTSCATARGSAYVEAREVVLIDIHTHHPNATK